MAVYLQGRALSQTEPVGLLTEGAAGIAAIVLAIIALAGVSTASLASIATIVIGVGLWVQAFNSAAEGVRVGTAASAQQMADIGGEVMIDFLAGGAGIVLGILGLIGLHTNFLVPAALTVFGASLVLSGAMAAQGRQMMPLGTEGATQMVTYQGNSAAHGYEILGGIAAVVLGILSLVMATSWTLVLVGFIVVGGALLMVSASFSGAVLRLLTTPTA